MNINNFRSNALLKMICVFIEAGNISLCKYLFFESVCDYKHFIGFPSFFSHCFKTFYLVYFLWYRIFQYDVRLNIFFAFTILRISLLMYRYDNIIFSS